MGGLASAEQAGGLCKGDKTTRRRAWGGIRWPSLFHIKPLSRSDR